MLVWVPRLLMTESRSHLYQLFFVMILCATACGRPEFGSTTSGGDVIEADYERESVNNANGATGGGRAVGDKLDNGSPDPILGPNEPAVVGEPVDPGELPFTVYRAEARQPRNVAIAPHGVVRSLVVAYAATEGSTASSIEALLGDELGSDLYAGFNARDQNLDNAVEDLGMLPAVWVDDDVAVESSFTEALARYLGLQVRLIDMSSGDDARSEINNWYAQQTGGEISEVLGPRTIESMDRFVVTDASWFRATWAFGGFDPDRTTFETFAGEESNVQLEMMHADATLLYFGEPELQAVVLPLDGGLSLVAVLPQEHAAFDAVVDASFVSRLMDEALPTDLSLSFPRVEVSDLTALSGVADELGVSSLYTSDAEYGGFADGTVLADAHHRVRVAFDESGIEVDTDGDGVDGEDPGMTPGPPAPLELRFDRPFFFGVRDAASGAFLLLGRVAQPG